MGNSNSRDNAWPMGVKHYETTALVIPFPDGSSQDVDPSSPSSQLRVAVVEPNHIPDCVKLCNWAAGKGVLVRPTHPSRAMAYPLLAPSGSPGSGARGKTRVAAPGEDFIPEENPRSLCVDLTPHVADIKELNTEERWVRVEAGCTQRALLTALAAADLTLPTVCPDGAEDPLGTLLSMGAHGWNGSLADAVLDFTCVVSNERGGYELKSFDASVPAGRAMLVNHGRSFVVEARFRLVPVTWVKVGVRRGDSTIGTAIDPTEEHTFDAPTGLGCDHLLWTPATDHTIDVHFRTCAKPSTVPPSQCQHRLSTSGGTLSLSGSYMANSGSASSFSPGRLFSPGAAPTSSSGTSFALSGSGTAPAPTSPAKKRGMPVDQPATMLQPRPVHDAHLSPTYLAGGAPHRFNVVCAKGSVRAVVAATAHAVRQAIAAMHIDPAKKKAFVDTAMVSWHVCELAARPSACLSLLPNGPHIKRLGWTAAVHVRVGRMFRHPFDAEFTQRVDAQLLTHAALTGDTALLQFHYGETFASDGARFWGSESVGVGQKLDTPEWNYALEVLDQHDVQSLFINPALDHLATEVTASPGDDWGLSEAPTF